MSNEKSHVFWKTNAATLFPDLPPNLNLGVRSSSKSSNPARQKQNTFIRDWIPQLRDICINNVLVNLLQNYVIPNSKLWLNFTLWSSILYTIGVYVYTPKNTLKWTSNRQNQTGKKRLSIHPVYHPCLSSLQLCISSGLLYHLVVGSRLPCVEVLPRIRHCFECFICSKSINPNQIYKST